MHRLITFTLLSALVPLSSFAQEKDQPSLSYSFFGVGQENSSYSETLKNFGGQAFKSQFDTSGLMQTSGGFTQVNPEWGFEIITNSTLLPEESKETWDFTGFGVVQTDNTTLSQNALTINGVYFPFQDGQKIQFGIRYQNIAFSRFNFKGTDQIDALNDALLANDSEYNRLLGIINGYVADVSNDPANGIPDTGNANALIVDEDGRLITSAAELKAARGLDPETQQGVIFEDASSITFTAGYGYDSYFDSQEPGLRWRAGMQIGLPVYLSVLNTNNNITLTETLPSGFDASLYVGAGYQFSKEIGVIAMLDYVHAQRDKIQAGNVYLPTNEFTSTNLTTQVYWAF